MKLEPRAATHDSGQGFHRPAISTLLILKIQSNLAVALACGAGAARFSRHILEVDTGRYRCSLRSRYICSVL